MKIFKALFVYMIVIFTMYAFLIVPILTFDKNALPSWYILTVIMAASALITYIIMLPQTHVPRGTKDRKGNMQ